MHISSTSYKGKLGEERLKSLLLARGYQIITQNYRCRSGEIDIVAQKGRQICFVEVKTRWKNYLDLSEVVNHVKQRRIVLAARHFLMQHQQTNLTYQFDVALLELQATGDLEIKYLENAFGGTEFD